MPLLILGLLLIGGILIYAIIGYINTEDEDPRSVRERYPHAFPHRKHGGGTIFGDIDENGQFRESDHPLARILRNEGRSDVGRPYYESAEEEKRKRENGENVIEFPTDNVEAEKIKRNIHSDRK